MIHHVKRATRHLIFWTLLIVAICLTSVRLVLIGVERYQASLEFQISELVGAPVKLHGLGAKMRRFSPELILKDIDIASTAATNKPAIHLEEIRLSVNLAEILFNRDVLSSSSITVVGARLSVTRTKDGELVIEGLKGGDSQPLWLLQGREYKLLQSQITWKDEQKKVAPIILDGVNLAIINQGDRHQIKLLTVLPKYYGDDLKVIMDIHGNANKPEAIKGKIYVEGSNLNLNKLVAPYLTSGLTIEKGAADFKIWSKWQQAKVAGIRGVAQLRQAKFLRTNKSSIQINNLDSQFRLQLKDQMWELDINRFLLESAEPNNKAGKRWPDINVSIASEQANDNVAGKFKAYVKQLDLAEITKLLSVFAPLTDGQTQLLEKAQVRGKIRDLSLYAEPDTKKYAIAGWFDAIGIESVLSVPGIENLSGQVKGSDKLGKLALSGQQVQLKAEQLFNTPLLFNQVKGLLTWQQNQEQWTLASDSIRLNCPGFQTESHLFVKIPKTEEAPFLDLQTALKSDDMSQIANYLPSKIMAETLNAWLSNAFVGGKITKGDFLFYGKLSDFPFNDGTGVLQAMADIDNLELNFNPSWPHVLGLGGKFLYDHNSILGVFNRGQMGKVTLTKGEALIPDLGSNDEQLTVKGDVQGEINEVLSVLKQSPLTRRITPFTNSVTMVGTTKGVFDLTVPLWAGREMKLDGNAQFANAQLTVKKLGLKVDKIVGALKFNMDGIYSDEIHAAALAHPITTTIEQSDQDTLINVNGTTTVNAIENLFNWPRSSFAEGEGDYQLQLQLPKSDVVSKPIQITVKSALEGVDLRLPGTLAKTGVQKKPSTVTVSLTDEKTMPIEINYNNELKTALSLNAEDHKVISGHILVGTGYAKQKLTPGIKLEINRDQLPLQDWLVLADSQTQVDSSGLKITELKINTKTAFWKKTKLGPFDMTLVRNLNYWSGEIDNTVAKGKFQLPIDMQNFKQIVLDMEMLNLTALKQFKLDSGANNTAFKPLLNIHSKKNMWMSENIGQLSVETQRGPQGMLIKRLELDGENEKLSLTGDWKDNGVLSTTHLKGRLDMEKADQFFDQLNITKDLSDTSGTIDIDINWNAAPWQLSELNLRGQMDVNFTGGRLLSVEPGFGRILGILAVEQWLKRLQLDFSDIYEEGLTFNTIKGHFDLLNGKAVTNDLTIDAIPAMITITGDTDLVKQTVDHRIKVVPKSLDAVPIAGTIVGKIASLVGKTLTGKNQEGLLFGTQYLVKGNWDDVKITSLHENEGLFPKTWHSITDFSWAAGNGGIQK